MKASLHWLNRLLSPGNASPEEAERALMNAGMPLESREPLPSGDTLLDVEVTSNRGDCISHLGLAREIAAQTGRTLLPPTWDEPPTSGEVGDFAKLINDQHNVCPLFTLRVIRGVKVGPSPAWLVSALESVGQRSINNVVDVTNFISLELGNPCHVFDLDRLAGRTLHIRWARHNEKLRTLDGKDWTLKADELVVADSERAQSLAGVIGGADSEVSARTVNVAFEMATWDPATVRRTARRLGIRTDAGYRFERTVDARTIGFASRRAVELIVRVAGGTLCEGTLSAGKPPAEPTNIVFRPDRCRGLLGIDISNDDMVAALRSLEFEINPIGRAAAELRITVPAFRPDVTREVDLIEEIARTRGIDHIPIAPKLSVAVQPPQPKERAAREMANLLTGLGFYETVTFSFTRTTVAQRWLVPGFAVIGVDDERRGEEPTLRPSLIPSLLACRKANQDGQAVVPGGIRLFETASIYAAQSEKSATGLAGAAIERRHLGLLMDIGEPGAKVSHENRQAGFRLIKGVVEAVVHSLGGPAAALEFTPLASPFGQGIMDAGAFAGVWLAGEALGYIGIIAPQELAQYKIESPLAAAELNLAALLALYPPKARAASLPAFPAVERDVSFIVAEAVTWAGVQSQIAAAALLQFEASSFVGTYRGKQIGAGKKSVTVRLRFRDGARTLRREEVDPQIAQLVGLLGKNLGAEVRSA